MVVLARWLKPLRTGCFMHSVCTTVAIHLGLLQSAFSGLVMREDSGC